MSAFEVEELHFLMGALEKRVSNRTYVFKNLPGTSETTSDPKLIISEDEKIIKEYAGDHLGRVKRIDEKTLKLTFHEERAGAMRKLMGKSGLTSRTIRFAEEDTDLVGNFILACQKLNPAATIEQRSSDLGDSEIESKTSLDNVSSARDSSNLNSGRRSPTGSLDALTSHDSSARESTLIEQLGGTGILSSESGSGLVKPETEAEDEVVGVRAPPPFPAAASLGHSQVYADFMREFAPSPKWFCRVRNRYGALEGKMIAITSEDVRFLSLVDQVVAHEEIVAGGKEVRATNNDEDEEDMSSILNSPPPASFASSASTSTSQGNLTVDGVVVKQDLVYFWCVAKARISKFVLYGLVGTFAIIVMDDMTDFDMSFETAGARNQFVQALFPLGSKDPRVVQLFPGGEECAAQDLLNGWSDFALISLKGMGSVRTSRMFALSRNDKSFWIFRNSDLVNNFVCESSEPFRSVGVPSSGMHIEPVKSSRTRLKFGLINSTTIASAPSSSSLVPSVKGDGSEKTTFDLLFPNFFERERFISHLHSLASTLRVTAPSPQLRAKYQRQAWHRPGLKWFEVKRTVFVGTFNVGDSPPPEPATLDLWVGHPVKLKRDMVTGGLRTQTRVRAKSGSAGVTGRFSLYVFGLQECGNKFEEWSKALQTHLGSEYCLVSSARLWEIGVLVFAALSEADKISCVETGTVATGRGIAKEVTGMQLGNKGGVAIGLKWRDTSLCFVNSHLAPHQEKILIRNQNFSQIMSKLGLTGSAGDAGELGLEPTHAFEHVFFFGDMNYRVDESFQKVIGIASQGKWSALMEMDQLKKEMETKRCYYGFREAGVPNFPPTYRWERNKRAFSNKRDQPPSYTDRILLHSRKDLEGDIQPLLYGSSQDIMISDHRPVAATFSMALREPYTPWPLHPLVAEIPKREVIVDDSQAGNQGGANDILLGSSQGGVNLVQQLEREASSDGGGGGSIGGSFDYSEGKPRPQSVRMFDPLYAVNSSSSNGNLVPSPEEREQELKDEDEEDEPDQFLGALGSFFVTPESFAHTAAPEIRLSSLVLKLEKKDGVDKSPPTFVQLKVASRILQEVALLEASPGMMDLAKPSEFAFNLESNNAKKDAQAWGDLFYTWHQQSSTDIVNQSGAATSEVLKPTVWDPCYLSTQHLLIAVEEISSSRKKEEAKKKASVLDDEEGAFDSPAAVSGRKTLTGAGGGGPGDRESNRISARMSRRKRSVGSTAMQIGSAIVGAATTAVSGSTSFAGQACISLKDVIEAARKRVAKDAGMAHWSRTQPVALDFCEPVIFGGVRVGELKGVVSLVPASGEEKKLMLSKKTALVGKVGGRQFEPTYSRQSFDVEVQLEGFTDKKGNGWRRVFVALDTSGTLFICSKTPGGNKSGQAMLDAMQRTALVVLDVTDCGLDYSVGAANAADRAFTMELTAKKISSSAYDTYQNQSRGTIIFSFNDDFDRKMWGTSILSILSQRRFESSFLQEMQRDWEGRKDQRARRLEIERKRRLDAEQLLLTPPLAKTPLARAVSFEENPPTVADQEPVTPPKSSFLSRAGLLLSAKRSNAKDELKGQSPGFVRGGWFGHTRSMQDMFSPTDEDSNPRHGASAQSSRLAAQSSASAKDGAAAYMLDVDGEEALNESLTSDGPQGSPTNISPNGEKRSVSPSQQAEAGNGKPGSASGEEKKSISSRLKERAKNSKLKGKKQNSFDVV